MYQQVSKLIAPIASGIKNKFRPHHPVNEGPAIAVEVPKIIAGLIVLMCTEKARVMLY